MKNPIIVLALATIFVFTANAQSKECCSKDKGETTKIEKSINDQTIKSGKEVMTVTTSVTELTGEKENVQKEVVITKMEMNEKCDDKSSCCSDMKKEKKIEKEVKKEIKKQ